MIESSYVEPAHIEIEHLTWLVFEVDWLSFWVRALEGVPEKGGRFADNLLVDIERRPLDSNLDRLSGKAVTVSIALQKPREKLDLSRTLV